MKKLILAILLAAGLTGTAQAGERGVNIYDTPRKVPAKEIIHNDLKRYKLSDFPDKFVMAVFWSRNCVPCVKELDSLNNMSKKVKDNGLQVVLVSPSREWGSIEEQRRFLDKYGAKDMDFYVDENGNLASELGIFTSPHTVLVNRKGEEIGRIRGTAEWDDDDVIEYLYKIKAQHG